jgi:nucleoside-diphosphate-sugar epimerase
MKIGIVGSTGVLGRAVIPLLVEQGHHVRALARSAAKARELFPSDVQIVEGDLLDTNTDLNAFLSGCEGAAHLATAIPKDFNAPGAWDMNTRLRTEGTERLLRVALETGVGYYVQQSIVMAYPDHGDEWITEDMPLDESRDVVITMEKLVRELSADRMNWCMLRGGAFLGAGTAQDEEIARLRAGTLRVPCDGRSFISPIHPADMGSAVALAFAHTPRNVILNINDEPLRLGDYFDRLAEAIGADKPPRDPAKPCPPSYRCSNQAARDILGWQPRHSIFPGA